MNTENEGTTYSWFITATSSPSTAFVSFNGVSSMNWRGIFMFPYLHKSAKLMGYLIVYSAWRCFLLKLYHSVCSEFGMECCKIIIMIDKCVNIIVSVAIQERILLLGLEGECSNI